MNQLYSIRFWSRSRIKGQWPLDHIKLRSVWENHNRSRVSCWINIHPFTGHDDGWRRCCKRPQLTLNLFIHRAHGRSIIYDLQRAVKAILFMRIHYLMNVAITQEKSQKLRDPTLQIYWCLKAIGAPFRGVFSGRAKSAFQIIGKFCNYGRAIYRPVIGKLCKSSETEL